MAAVAYRERERMNFVVHSKVWWLQTDTCERVEQLFLLSSSSCLSGTIPLARDMWGAPVFVLPLGALARVTVWVAAIDTKRARGKDKKNSQWEWSTPSYALVLERFTSLKTIQHLHFTVGDTGSSPLKKIRERTYLPLFQARWKRTLLHLQQWHVQNRGNVCGCVRCDTLRLNPHPCLRTARTEAFNSVSALQIEQRRVLLYTK